MFLRMNVVKFKLQPLAMSESQIPHGYSYYNGGMAIPNVLNKTTLLINFLKD